MGKNVFQSLLNWQFTCVLDAKRLIGRKFDEPEVKQDMKHWPFEVKNEGGRPKVEVQYKGETKRFFPEEVCRLFSSEPLLLDISGTNP